MDKLIFIENVTKVYNPDTTPVHALRGISFSVDPGEYVAIMGASGSGKSTLMNILGCLDIPTEGRYLLADQEVETMDDDDLAKIRNREIGFVFQQFNLLPRSTALYNVELPLIYAGVSRRERDERARESLKAVGLEHRVGHAPNELSGGEQQRVAIARALVTNPALILADEPTGNLDTASSSEIMAIFDRLNGEGKSIVMVTHEEDIAGHTRRAIRLRDGQIIGDDRK
ncbi:MAG TPA: ABC transporter ATP-binding protein [Thermoanaerobaculia bacterium]|nr:ABC transporter ATP-binding protein [Thermoanaerobaculia bacterium]HUM29264.1 ABC transporter ATP-binding protein [Thermoanaerobaculia bacterium]HXK67778.1 ABC transporter ATP-binding protein [Thermoanaerobaculia bacterium]